MAYKDNVIDYTETTYTPTITSVGGSPSTTYSTQIGLVTIIGNVVNVKATVVVNTASGGTGAVRFNLPYTNSGTNATGTAYLSSVTFPGSTIMVNINIDNGVSYCDFRVSKDNSGGAAVQYSVLSSGSLLRLDINYMK